MISNCDVEFIYHRIIKENAKHFWFYTHNRLRIKALLSAVNIILSNRPEKNHSVTSAVRVIFFYPQMQNSDSFTQDNTHKVAPHEPHEEKDKGKERWKVKDTKIFLR